MVEKNNCGNQYFLYRNLILEHFAVDVLGIKFPSKVVKDHLLFRKIRTFCAICEPPSWFIQKISISLKIYFSRLLRIPGSGCGVDFLKLSEKQQKTRNFLSVRFLSIGLKLEHSILKNRAWDEASRFAIRIFLSHNFNYQ